MVVALLCLFFLIANNRMSMLADHIRSHKCLLFSMSILDNIAWVAFAASATLIPITISVALSGGYTALAALLGILINSESIMTHQKIGLVVALVGAIVLASVYAY